MDNIRYILILFLISVGTLACSQKRGYHKPDSQNPPQDTLFLKDTLFVKGYGVFDNYVFMLDGKKIEREALTDYPEAWLERLDPGLFLHETYWYPGVLYFKTSEQLIPPPGHAYFINGRQVTYYDLRRSKPEAYTHIEKSEQDTLIDGVSYKGTIHVGTKEDFFARLMTVTEFLIRYPGLSPGHTLIQLAYRGSPASIIYNNLDRYHIDPQQLLPVKAGRVRLSGGIQNVVQLADTGYQLSAAKAGHLFRDPSQIDVACPCYLTNFDTEGRSIHYGHNTELKPAPLYGTNSYLRRLSETLALPGAKTEVPSLPHLIDVEFIVTRAGMLADLKTTSPDSPGDERILQAVKRHSCEWSVALMGGRPLIYRHKMTIYYTVDQKGNILSLDSLKFRHDR